MVKGRFLGSRSKYSGINQHLQDGVCIIGFLCMPLAIIKELVEFKFVVDLAQGCVAKVFSKVVSDAKPVRIITIGDIQPAADEITEVTSSVFGRLSKPIAAPINSETKIGFIKVLRENTLPLFGTSHAIPIE